METSIVHQLHGDFAELAGVLNVSAQPSLYITANDCFRKALLLAAASNFEMRVTATIVGYVEQATKQDALVCEFVRQKGLSRQYHSLFDWQATNANRFFALFGAQFKKFAEQRVKADSEFDRSVRAFLALGNERNRLVHQDFGSFSLEMTADEIFELFKVGSLFVDGLQMLFAGAAEKS